MRGGSGRVVEVLGEKERGSAEDLCHEVKGLLCVIVRIMYAYWTCCILKLSLYKRENGVETTACVLHLPEFDSVLISCLDASSWANRVSMPSVYDPCAVSLPLNCSTIQPLSLIRKRLQKSKSHHWQASV